uniref:Uncharacterized protein n=1 Tax=Romanomermis culicivorax TaxID=13658 RepID=A0A915K8S4_ROMCU
MMHSLFEKCIVEALAGKTRILAAHQVQYLKSADLIVIMKQGKVAATGIYSELVTLIEDFSPTIQQESLSCKVDGTVEDFRDSRLAETENYQTYKDEGLKHAELYKNYKEDYGYLK